MRKIKEINKINKRGNEKKKKRSAKRSLKKDRE